MGCGCSNEDSAELKHQSMHTKTQRKRHGATFAAVAIACVALLTLVFGVVVSPPDTMAAANAPNSQLILATSLPNVSDYAAIYNTTPAITGSPGNAAEVNTTQATIQGTKAITDAITTKEVSYDVICPITATQNGQNNIIDQLTQNIATTYAGTVTLNGALNAILPTFAANTLIGVTISTG